MKTKKESNMMIIILFIIYVCLSAGGLILFKLGSGETTFSVNVSKLNLEISLKMIAGIFCYGFSFVLWLFIVSKMQLSVAMPLSVGLVNLLVLLGSSIVLKENINVCQWIGVVIIVIGLGFINIGGN